VIRAFDSGKPSIPTLASENGIWGSLVEKFESPSRPESAGVHPNPEGGMKSPVVKRSIVVAGHKTSVSLEDAFWKGLKEIATGKGVSLSEMVGAIDSARAQGNLSSALRLFVLDHFRSKIAIEDGTNLPRPNMLEAG
jgi:predicted DNA-binding ribbon-helix-helix protein